MSTDKKTLLQKIKAFFDAPIVAVAPVTPATPVGTATPFKLQDGSDVMITIEDPTVSMTPDAGDVVTIAGAPAPDASYTLEDGSTFTTAGGSITVFTPPVPVTQTSEQLAAAAEAARLAALPTVLTAEIVEAMYAKFATGTPEERLANLEIMMKAVMESNFGYDIRKGQENAAIQIYKDTLANATAAIAPTMATALAKIEKQDEVIKMQFELLEQIIATPTGDPITLTGSRKDRFDKLQGRENKFAEMAAAFDKAKNKNKNPATA